MSLHDQMVLGSVHLLPIVQIKNLSFWLEFFLLYCQLEYKRTYTVFLFEDPTV